MEWGEDVVDPIRFLFSRTPRFPSHKEIFIKISWRIGSRTIVSKIRRGITYWYRVCCVSTCCSRSCTTKHIPGAPPPLPRRAEESSLVSSVGCEHLGQQDRTSDFWEWHWKNSRGTKTARDSLVPSAELGPSSHRFSSFHALLYYTTCRIIVICSQFGRCALALEEFTDKNEIVDLPVPKHTTSSPVNARQI